MSDTTTVHDQYYEMANAPVNRIIPKLAVPTIISMLVTSIYNMADTFFVSQLGTSASGAIGIVFSAMAIIQALSFMVGMGSGNYIARSIGAGKRQLAEQVASVAFFTGLLRHPRNTRRLLLLWESGNCNPTHQAPVKLRSGRQRPAVRFEFSFSA